MFKHWQRWTYNWSFFRLAKQMGRKGPPLIS